MTGDPMRTQAGGPSGEDGLAPCASGTVFLAGGAAVRYWLCGDHGPVLLLCNGFCSGPGLWAPLVRALRGSVRLLLWEYPGQGMSHPQGISGGTGVSRLAKDALLLMDGVGIDRAVVAGHGVGVQVAAEVLALESGRVLALVGLCGGPAGLLSGWAPHAVDRLLERVLRGLMVPAGLPAWKLLRALDEAGGTRFLDLRAGDGKARERAQASRPVRSIALRWTDANAALGVLSSLLLHHPGRSRRSLSGGRAPPVLLLAGEADRVFPPRLFRDLPDVLPGAILTVLPGCSHRALEEDPESVVRHLSAFLLEHGIA